MLNFLSWWSNLHKILNLLAQAIYVRSYALFVQLSFLETNTPCKYCMHLSTVLNHCKCFNAINCTLSEKEHVVTHAH